MRAAIIGGGPAGLIQAYALQTLGIPYVIFERNADFGGLWNRDDPASPIYDSAHLISSRTMTGFAGYPMPDDWPDYPSAAHILQYIRDFARKFDLYEHTFFGENVESAVPVTGGWRLKTSTGRDEVFGWVIAANGSNWQPIIPNWPGQFKGRLRHGASFKNANEVTGKRVLVVGLGNSGVDIASDVSRTAASVHVSLRRGYHVVPKHILGKPADVFADETPPLPFWIRRKLSQILLRFLNGDLGRYGMPKPDHKLLETHPLLNDQFVHHLSHGDVAILGDIQRFDGDLITFKDGTSREFDEVICATGFEWEVPYVDPSLLPWERGRLAPPLAIFPEVENFFLLSFVESNGSSFSLFNDMSWIIGRAILAARSDPAEYQRLRRVVVDTRFDVTNGLKMQDTDRHVGYMDNPTYRRALKKLRKIMGWPKSEAGQA
ncbi:MAG: hypothetical protein ACI861_002403 [Paracoccaceae bacterium]|jgi:hypothetical protein